MKVINLKPNLFNALKLHWAGGHLPSKIAEKCGISVMKYHQLVRISQYPDTVIKCLNEDNTMDVSMNVSLKHFTKI